MAFLLCSNPLPASLHSSAISPPSSSSSCFPSNFSAASSMLHIKPIGFQPKHFNGIQVLNPTFVQNKMTLIVKATSEIASAGGTDSNDPVPVPTSEDKKEVVSVDKLPLESKLQERLEQKTRMKLAKKIRLRRKRLVRKRHLRKKGRWPPSKMKKLKNV